MFRFTIRDVLWLTVLAAASLVSVKLAVGGNGKEMYPAFRVFLLGAVGYFVITRARAELRRMSP
jgi:hypothetical protein